MNSVLQKIIFLTGTRADYGKLKPLMRICDQDPSFTTYIFVIGMHLLSEYGATFRDIVNDGYANIELASDYCHSDRMEENLASAVTLFSKFVRTVKPAMIVIHGDRVEALAGAIVGIMNNARVAHIEGGEVSGTVDEFMRHAISKLSNIHFVANDEAKFRLLQMGEQEQDIFVIGSPDIDIMLSDNLPDFGEVAEKYNVPFSDYAILIYHPVTTETDTGLKAETLVRAAIDSGNNYLVIHPNNDHGSDEVLRAYKILDRRKRFKIFKSLPFEMFLIFLKYAEFIIGNSSAGIREACVYGVPAIDVGNRQAGRYNRIVLRNIVHANEDKNEILKQIFNIHRHRFKSNYFGKGDSAVKFLSIVKRLLINTNGTQKQFIDSRETTEAIRNYINEVCY